MDYIDRLLKYFDKNKISGTQIAQLLGLSKTPLTDWKNRKSSPTVKHLLIICRFFSLSSDWILTGKEQTPNFNNLSNIEIDMILKFRQLSEENKQDAYEIINLKYNRSLGKSIE